MADNVAITEGSGTTIAADEIAGAKHQRVKITLGADGTNDGDVSSANPMPVSVAQVDRVANVVDGTISTVTFVPVVQRVQNVVDGTLSTVTGVDRVRNIIDGTISTVTGVDRVRNIVDGTISTVTSLGTATRVDRVMNLVDGTISTVAAVTGITNSINVHVLSTNGTMAVFSQASGTVSIKASDGTMAVYFSPSRPAVLADNQHTSSIFTVSGTTSTVGNNQLVAPSANYNFKVFAYSIQTTGIVSSAPRFTTGASAGATELWRPLINSVQTASTPVGANLAVAPPGFLFATGVSTTLSLYLDTGTLIHYSVSYIKESA